MKIFRFVRSGLMFTPLMSVAIASQASAQELAVLKFATTEPPASVATQIWQRWAIG